MLVTMFKKRTLKKKLIHFINLLDIPKNLYYRKKCLIGNGTLKI